MHTYECAHIRKYFDEIIIFVTNYGIQGLNTTRINFVTA